MTTGMLMAIAVAVSRLQFGEASEKNEKMPSGSVRMGADEIMVSAYRYSSQAKMKVNTAVATMPGTAGGRATSTNAATCSRRPAALRFPCPAVSRRKALEQPDIQREAEGQVSDDQRSVGVRQFEVLHEDVERDEEVHQREDALHQDRVENRALARKVEAREPVRGGDGHKERQHDRGTGHDDAVDELPNEVVAIRGVRLQHVQVILHGERVGDEA